MDSAQAYEIHAHEFLKNREHSRTGFNVVKAWADSLPQGSDVLELACGGGYPVTTELNKAGLKLWAIDSSETLLSVFRSRFPHVQTRCEKLQESRFFDRQFDAVVAIGIVFLLSEHEQSELIHKVSKALNLQGRFLFTAPVEIGKWDDLSTGVECNSLGLDRYTHILSDAGFEIVSQATDTGGSHYFDVVNRKKQE